jgi:hypothetical protein
MGAPQLTSDQIGQVSAFVADYISAQRQRLSRKADSLMPSEPARQEQRKKRSVPFPFETLTIRCLPKRVRLLCREPISEPHAEVLYAFDPANTARKVGTEQPTISGLLSEPHHRRPVRIAGFLLAI